VVRPSRRNSEGELRQARWGGGREGRRESSGRGGKQRWIYTRGGARDPSLRPWQSSKGARAATPAGASKPSDSLFKKPRFPDGVPLTGK